MTTTPSYHDRLDELKVQNRDASVSRGYTRFVKLMRYGLPILAVALIAVVITWPEMDDKIVVVNKADILPESQNDIGQNELLNPTFETTDAQQQPVNVTANRALQNSENPNVAIQSLNSLYIEDFKFLKNKIWN